MGRGRGGKGGAFAQNTDALNNLALLGLVVINVADNLIARGFFLDGLNDGAPRATGPYNHSPALEGRLGHDAGVRDAPEGDGACGQHSDQKYGRAGSEPEWG